MIARLAIALAILAGFSLLIVGSVYLGKHPHPYHALLKHTGLSGRDGDLSFSKAVTLLVLFMKPPVVLGVACVAASFGARAFGHFLDSRGR